MNNAQESMVDFAAIDPDGFTAASTVISILAINHGKLLKRNNSPRQGPASASQAAR
jgi:hypothetical protein